MEWLIWLRSPEHGHGALYSHVVLPEFVAAINKPMGNFQEQNLLLSSLWHLLSCSIWLGSFPTVAPSWNCVIAGDAAVINSKTSFTLLWLYMKARKCEPSKAQNIESKSRNYSEFIFSTRVFETHFKMRGTLCLIFETKVGTAKTKWALFTSHWFLWMKGWWQGGGGGGGGQVSIWQVPVQRTEIK